MRRSDRSRRVPARYSPTLAAVKTLLPQKSGIVSKYKSKNIKSVNPGKTAAVKTTAELSSQGSPMAHRSSEILSKYAKPGEPSIAEIFGANPDSGSGQDNDAQMEEIDVTGEEEPTKEPPSWIEAGPLEAKAAPSQAKVKKCTGIPRMGYGDLISQTAALPRSSYPILDTFIEGAATPGDKPGQKTLAPQKKKLIQQHLILLLHAFKCNRAASTKLPCPIPFCSVMKKVQSHMRQCTDGYNCSAPFCSSSRRIMCHWKQCKTPDCVVCSRLKCIYLNKRKKALERLKALGMPLPVKQASGSNTDATVAKVASPAAQGKPSPLVNAA
ncbi:histone acetyltransferase p300 [Frankliniella occidentalis]|uniref:histone acetyltransferase n=1 Tax=Frankliniella occidentalis TaxID=133901 RepID=A0A6J1RUX8_FRAOC|nr:histone acetyltransferase p300 [Frankliniella occidentalis]